MDYQFRKAYMEELPAIWEILQQAILRRKQDGSEQWQSGYPNPEIVREDIERGVGFVLVDADNIIGYSAVIINDEPSYLNIDGKWITNGDFVVIHRVAISDKYIGKGLAKIILGFVETFAVSNGIFSVKADTNFDNPAMMKSFEKAGYQYCGEVYFHGSARKAYEKVLSK